MNGFERRREKKKDSIRQAALQLFMNHGMRRVSIGEIAAKAGVSQVTIYNHFGSKEELASHVIKHFLEEKWEEYLQQLEAPIPFIEKLNWFFLKRMQLFESFNLDFLEEFVMGHPDIAAITKEYELKARPLMIAFIEEGKATGFFNKELSLETILLYLNLYSTQMVTQLEQLPDDETKRRVYKELLSIFFYGIAGEKAEELKQTWSNQ
ncbi:TetR/AcrR family transcriptional regulator [Bacillus horti]|uniref:AcrR family transcriptional regulator n=1 Tax=Caldalkalibacillus horti TaxID=77523 RepID=A0ABT9VZ69_9BACI|nr:TetR/AcrR family transcriptional regulator [Bacillus horti]MDQ0166272.1 AcrR family transcriptional regulator [Bacillus horti]